MKVVLNNMKKIVFSTTVLLLVLVTSGGVARAGHQHFHGTASVLRCTLSEFKLSQDKGTTYTENLLDGPTSVDWASKGEGQKQGEYISHKALPTGHYNYCTFKFSGFTFKGVVAVDPTQWEGTWDGSDDSIRYYYTNADGTSNKYKDNEGEAEAVAEEWEIRDTVLGEGWAGVDLDISAGETSTLKLWEPCLIGYKAEYDDDKKFTDGGFSWWGKFYFE